MSEVWTLLLSEVVDESEAFTQGLPGVVRLWERLWVYPGRVEREVLYGESSLLGPVFARPVFHGTPEEVRAHPAFQWGAKQLARDYYYALVNRSPKAPDLEARMEALGLQDLVAEVRGTAERYRAMQVLLSLVGVPHRPGEPGEVLVGQAQWVPITTPEEAELVARTYRWAKDAGVGISPAPRGPKGELRFYVDVLVAKPRSEGVFLPVQGNGAQGRFFTLRRVGAGVVAEPVRMSAPKAVRLVFLPHRR